MCAMIVCLSENTPGVPGCLYEHGLCLYVKTGGETLLFDTAQTDTAVHNARLLGLSLAETGRIFLSHGHYDHSGGLFLLYGECPEALVYLQRTAPERHFHGEKEIGMTGPLPFPERTVFLSGDAEIPPCLSVFRTPVPGIVPSLFSGNMYRERNGARERDDFDHEQSLVIKEGNRRILLSGCAHSGILNILARFREKYGGEPDTVISGFHMMKKEAYTPAEREYILYTAAELEKMKHTLFITGHCTGEEAGNMMKSVMGDRLLFMHSGERLL